jgi:AraC family transcriptional regulator
MESSLDSSLPLEEVAAQSCLSPFHLHRLFARAFGETPHQYLVRRRIERAADLLARTDTPVTLICLECGFQSLGSFSSLFRKRLGASPMQYRSQKRAARISLTGAYDAQMVSPS